MRHQTRRKLLANLSNHHNLAGIVAVSLFVVVGYFSVQASRAATFATAQEAEGGVVTGNFTPGDTAGASNNASIRFGAATPTTT